MLRRRKVFRNTMIVCTMGAAFLLAPTAHAENWGSFKKEHCTFIGKRQHSAVLHNISWGKSWEAACAVMPASINGHYLAKPNRCVNNGQMWGQFDVPDESCPKWGSWRKESCETIPKTKLKGRRYSARMWEAPVGATWQAACAAAPITINNVTLSSPMACAGAGNISLIKASVGAVVMVASAVAIKVQPQDAAAKAANIALETVKAANNVSEAVQVALKSQKVQTTDVDVVDKRKEWTEMWGIVWLPEKGCGL